MGNIAVVTDSNSGITQAEAKEYGIHVLPMPFFINGETYFEDIDFEEDIVMLNGKYDWKLIERRLIDMTQIQNKVFESFPLS